jgi:hypothetical protein
MPTSETPAARRANAQHQPKPRFARVIWQNGRGYVLRSELNRYKAELTAAALGVAPVYPPRVDPDPLVPLKAVCEELGVGRRTIGRRIAESRPSEAWAESRTHRSTSEHGEAA